MTEPVASTAWLSLLIGAYLVAGGIGAWVRGDRWRELLDDFHRSPALVAVTGAVAFTIGAAIVSIHNIWTDLAAIVITLCGWIAVVEGLTLLAFPEFYLRIARPMISMPKTWATVMAVIGVLLVINAVLSGVFAAPL
jgi:uncharacterized protein YjeT (DUF2065 family)